MDAEDARRKPYGGDLLLIVLVGAFGGLVTWWATPHGLIESSDTMAYLSAAGRLAHGHGPTTEFTPPFYRYSVAEQLAHLGRIPMEGWPPGYSVLLAVGMRLGMAPLDGARWLSVAAGTILGVATGWIARRRLSLPIGAVLGIGFVVLLAPTHLLVDLFYLGGRMMALSEGIYLAVGVMTIAVGCAAFSRRSWTWIALACLGVGLTTMVRSTGPTIGIALAAGALVDPLGRGWTRRFARSTAVALVASGIVTTGAWLVANKLVWHAAGKSSRQLGWYPNATMFRGTAETVSGWFGLGYSVPLWIAAVVTVVCFVAPVVAVAVPSVRRALAPGRPVEQATMAALGAAVATGWLAVSATYLTMNRDVRLTPRHLAIVQPFTYLLLGVILVRLLERVPLPGLLRGRTSAINQTRFAGVAVLVCCGLLGAMTFRSVHRVLPLSTKAAQHQALTDFSQLPGSVVLASDNPQRVWASARRPILLVPPAKFVTTYRVNPSFRSSQDQLVGLARRGTLLLVSYGTAGLDRTATQELSTRAGFVVQAHCADGATLLAVPDTPAQTAARALCEPVPDPA